MKKRSPSTIKSIGDVLDDVVENLGLRKKLKEQEVFVLWEEAVGSRIAAVAIPARMRRGTLVVRVTSSVWRNELSMRKQEIVRRLNDLLTEELVNDITFQ